MGKKRSRVWWMKVEDCNNNVKKWYGMGLDNENEDDDEWDRWWEMDMILNG